MDLYFAGSEVPSWRKVLAAEGVEHVALSYVGLRRRVKMARPWSIGEKYPADQKVFLDSGAYTVNSAEEERYTVGQIKDLAAGYMDFAAANIDAVEFVSEFDALALGIDWIKGMREDFWDDLPAEKFLPIWHADWGLGELDALCQRYPRVGLSQTSLNGRNLVPALNSYVRQYGTKLHGIAMTKPDLMAAVNWDSVASTSWISPSQFGDTIIWTGNELKRYPKKMKETARKRHRTYIKDIGFDPEKIEADDSSELIRLSIWSWRQVVSSLERTTVERQVATPTEMSAEGDNAEPGTEVVGTSTPEVRKQGTTVTRRREISGVLPVMGLATATETYVDDSGEQKKREVPLVNLRSESQRVCSSCFLAAKCPAFEEGANCAYEIPVTIKTKDQMQALQNALIEMQSQRVMFMKMAEDFEGGYADPNLSGEMDRLQKMIKVKTELEQDSFSFKVEAKGNNSGQAGLLSRLFGSEAGAQARALPAPLEADDVIATYDIVDAEVLPNSSQRSRGGS